MIRFILRRIAASLLLLYLVLTTTFFLLHLAPGSPAGLLVEDSRIPTEQREQLRRIYGLDRPLPVQYARWLAAVARGNLGTSFSYQRPVTAVVLDALPATLLLAAAALVVEQAVGLIFGIAAARRPGSATDHLIRIVSLLLYSQPSFWLGLMAILLFSLVWPVLPAGQMRSTGFEDLGPAARLLDLLRHLALPALVLGLAQAGAVVRFVRGSLLEILGQEYIRAARAKGISERRVVWIHALRNALPPLIQVLALSASLVLSGTLVTEVVFAWPGLGRLTFEAILSRDYPLVLATTGFAAVVVLLANLAADVLHALSDPRVRDA
ncbi:MAG TPA: ABC transporter permease [Thermoanaerobaculia bacterium]|nr:ABC transporter permease [Thermoanaerobaculia bacterium]